MGVWYKGTTNIAAALGMAVGYIVTFGYLIHTEFFGLDFIQLFGSKDAILAAARQAAAIATAPDELKAEAAAIIANAASLKDGALSFIGNAIMPTDSVVLRGRVTGRLWGINNISGAIFGVPISFLVIYLVSKITPAPSQAMQDFIDDIRIPRGGVRLVDRQEAVE